MSNKAVFSYAGTPVTFQTGEVTMVNATQMAKPFGKRTSKWLELPSTREFIRKLEAIRKSDRLVVTANGVGTWMHEDVALEFARWLSPDFAIWCNDRIKELMRYGITATPQTMESVIADPDNAIRLLTALRDERRRVVLLEDQKRCYQSENRRLLRLMDKQRTGNVPGGEATFTTTEIAKEMGMSAHGLNKFLHNAGILYRQGSHWFLYQQYADKGFTKTRERLYMRKDGRSNLTMTTVWTEAGRMFIHGLKDTK